MNNRYTYGYINGWDVENSYIQDQLAIMDVYNEHRKVLDRLQQDIALVDADIVRDGRIDEETIRTWYNEDVDKTVSNKTYEEFRNDIMESRKQHYDRLKQDAERKVDRYSANLYYMSEIKGETRKLVNQRRRELELLLEERRLERSTIAFERERAGVQYDENRNILNQDQLREFSAREDANWLEIRKIEHALRELDNMSQELEFSDDELDLMRKGLNPQQRRYYDEIDKSSVPSLTPQEPNKQKTYEPTPGPTGNDNPSNDEPTPDPVGNDNPTGNDNPSGSDVPSNDEPTLEPVGNDIPSGDIPNTDELDKLQNEFEIDLSKYNDALAEYEKHLAEYKKLLEELYELQNEYENDRIPYSQYKEFADHVLEEYKKILEEYNKLKEMYDKLKQMLDELNALSASSLEELTNKLRKLEADFNEEYHFRAHQQNGLEYNGDDFIGEYNRKKKEIEDAIKAKQGKYYSLSDEELNEMLKKLESDFNKEYHFRAQQQNGLEYNDDDFIGEYNRKKKEIEDELKRRKKYEIREPEAPEEPKIILEKIKDDEEIIEDPKNEYYNLKYLINKVAGPYKYTNMDDFIYTNKEIKCFNWNKKRERTFLDKPMKLVKAGISTVILGGSKLFAKAAYTRESVREKIEFCLQNVEKLTDEEAIVLFKGLTATRDNAWQNIIPKVAFNALHRRIVKIVHAQVGIINSKLKVRLISITNLYKEAQKLKKQLNNQNSTPEEIMAIEERLKEISKELCYEIDAYDKDFKEADSILNASGLYGFTENFRARKNISVGGRNARYVDSPEARGLGGITGEKIQTAVRNGDGLTAAEYFIYDQQVEIENTEIKRTLKNRFGKASTGIYQYSPLVKQADYSEDDYLKDVLQTIMLASSIINAAKIAALQNKVVDLNNQLRIKNLEINQLNAEITQLKGMFPEYTTNPNGFLDKYYTSLKHSIGGMQASSEYFGMQAQASDVTSNLVSAGPKYKLFDEHSHNFFGGLDRQVDTIFNDPSLSYSDKILQMGKAYEQGVNELARQAVHHQADITAHIAKFGNNYDFGALTTAINTASTVNPAIVTNVFNEYVQAAIFAQNMQALSVINTMPINVDMTAAVVNLASIVGHGALEDYRRAKRENPELFPESDIEEIKQAMNSVKIDEHEIAKSNYEEAKAEWDSKNFLYKIFHIKEKPKRIDYDADLMEERYGRSL